MKTKAYKHRVFSGRFDSITLHDLVSKRKTNNQKADVRNNSLFPEARFTKFKTLEKDFVKRLSAQEVIMPNRFVWHVCDEGNTSLKNFSIVKDGLLTSFSELHVVFANNNLYDIAHFYPFCVHSLFTPDYAEQGKDRVLEFGKYWLDSVFWRIDTYAFHAEWRIDPNMRADGYEKECANYICTTRDIPAHALKAFRLMPGKFLLPAPVNAQVAQEALPLFLLSPDQTINSWLDKLHKKAA